MAYDEALAERVRDLLTLRGDVTERKMFGGIAWMVSGNMACGILGDDLIVRLEPADLAGWVEAGVGFASSLPPK